MLTQSNIASQPDGGFATLSAILTPNNRLHLSVKPIVKYHRQGKARSAGIPTGCNICTTDYKTGEIYSDFDQASFAGAGEERARPGYLASLSNCAKDETPGEVGENRHPPLPPKKVFTRRGSETIQNAASALMKSGYEPRDFYFFTGTLPGSSLSACEMFSRYSRQFLDSLKKSLRRLGLYLTFNCWEWQLRNKRNLVPALHLHLVVVCQDEELAAQLPDFLKTRWFELLDYYSEKSGVSLYEKHEKLGGGEWTKEDLEKLSTRAKNPLQTCKTIRCEKSPANYLSKYVSKGCLASDETFQKRFKGGKIPLFYPSSWWSISDHLRKLVKEYTHPFSVHMPLKVCRQKFDELSEFFSDCANLILNKFSPSFAPDCQYQSIYIHGEKYQEISDLLYEIFNRYSDEFNTRFDESSGYAKLPVLKDVALDWLFLPKNYNLYLKFMSQLPYYQTSGDVDLTSDYMKQKAAEFVSSLKFSNRFN